jgi:putative sugar O-methyltransferase
MERNSLKSPARASRLRWAVRRAIVKIVNDYRSPALAHSEELFKELAAARESESPGGEWDRFTAEISDALRMNGADEFLRLAPIAKTLHSRQRSVGQRYWLYLLRSAQFSPMVHKALTESPVGRPLLHPYYPLSSPLLVQHGYHLVRLLEATDLDISALRLIVEFGGGYGSFYRLLRNLGYVNRYVIADLPVMCALQRFYLRNMFPTGDAQAPANLQWLPREPRQGIEREQPEHTASLFVATWSLSETPLTVRDEIVPVLSRFKYVLCAYQRQFGGQDNLQYFTSVEKTLPEFKWHHAECPVYRNNFYLIGLNTASG